MKKDKGLEKILKKISKNTVRVNSFCKSLAEKYKNESKLNHSDYIYFVFSSDILHRIKDLMFLSKKINASKSNFDSSLYVLSRSILETFIYMKYLLSEEDKITLRLNAMICHSSENDLTLLNSLKSLGDKNKFIFNKDEKSITSVNMITKKTNEWAEDIDARKKTYQNGLIDNELKILKKIELVSTSYDTIMNIKEVTEGGEHKSFEWLYNYVYRFQCMSSHQNLRDKEKVFSLYLDDKNGSHNSAVLVLIDNILEEIILTHSELKTHPQ